MKKVLIDCRTWKDRKSAHESLKKELELPAYYGRNADALYDMLTERDFAVILCNASAAREQMGKDFDTLLRVMRDADALDRVYDGLPGSRGGREERREAEERCAALEKADDPEERERLLRGLFGRLGARPRVEKGFRCLCGSNIHAGDDLEIYWGVTVLDEAPVILGDRVRIGAGVLFASRDPFVLEGESGLITVGNDVAIGARCVILPGAVIPDGAAVPPGRVVGTEWCPDGQVSAERRNDIAGPSLPLSDSV